MSNEERTPPKVAGRGLLVTGLSEASLEAASTDMDTLVSPSLSGWGGSPHSQATIHSTRSMNLGRQGATAPTPRRAAPIENSLIAAVDAESSAFCWDQDSVVSPHTRILGRHGAAAPTPRRAAPTADGITAAVDGESPASPSTARCFPPSSTMGDQVAVANTPQHAAGSGKKRAGNAQLTPRYWSDASYSHFYDLSQEEQTLMKSATAGAGLTRIGVARMAAAWRRNGEGVPPSRAIKSGYRGALAAEETRPGQLSERQVARFQQAFAELSSGRGWIPAGQAPVLLRALGVPLPASLVAKFVHQLAAEEDAKAVQTPPGALPYNTAFCLYEEVVVPDVTTSVVRSAIDEFVEEVSEIGCAEQVLPSDGQRAQATLQRPAARAAPFEAVADHVLHSPGKDADSLKKLHDLMRHEQYASLYRPPASSSPRAVSIFKKVGRFNLAL